MDLKWSDPADVPEWSALEALDEAQARIEHARKLHWKATFTDVSLGIRDLEVCAICHTVLDEPEDWPEGGPEWSYPNVQEPYPCPTLRALG